MATVEQLVLDEIRRAFAGVPRYDLGTARVVETNPFLVGSLNTVVFKRTDGSEKTVYAWAPELDKETGKLRGDIRAFADTDKLIAFVSAAKIGPLERFFSGIGFGDAVSGLIAILMTLAVIFTVYIQTTRGSSTIEVPAVLSNVLTIIVGFYFGRTKIGQN